ncbi:MAG: restriction endonuclease [Clostridia bacterium]|nr:restriction endonuclease [Clostridia bacterium]
MASKYLYQAEVSHNGLNKYRIVKAENKYELNQKVNALQAQWNEQWEKKVERENRIKNDEDSIIYAAAMTKQAEQDQKNLDEILLSSLKPQKLDLDELKDYSEYSEPQPEFPNLDEVPIEPHTSDSKYNPKPSFFTKLSKKKMEEFLANNVAEFEKDFDTWEKQKNTIETNNDKKYKEYNILVKEWEAKRDDFKRMQAEENKKMDLFFEGEPEAVEKYFKFGLESIHQPFGYNRFIDLEYDNVGKILIIDLFLPVTDDIPNLKSVSYVKSKKEFKETYYPDSYIKKKYDSVIYQIVLQTLNYIFFWDSAYALIDSVVINGKIDTIDKATGKCIEPYVLSVSVAKEKFEEINLAAVDPKAWFKSAKGISAASLANVTPIPPIVTLSREDKRFIEGYDVVDGLNDSVNLAAIDWQDFENLIREIFEKEFNTNGGEVKITQASRDGGVDAVAFDPDPIRGGKIVIQAKRYTNVVGVSAVRDLYGTVLNEGASKGILVTTSNFGNDAYNFAQGKPITLMNGANLLYLLEKHGYKARIDLKEAKDTLRDK